MFTQVLGQALAFQPALSRCFHRFDEHALKGLQNANQTLVDKVHRFRQSKALLLDLDYTYGRQENATYNAHYRTVGFHPLLAFDGLTGDFFKVKLRKGSD